MNRITYILLTLQILHFAIQSAKADEYSGSVGGLQADFSLEFHDDGSVSGTYSYPSNKGSVYLLSGSNPRQGELYLEEYTGATLSAKCYLSKRVTEDFIVWEGVMQNTDGREFDMFFSRARGAKSKPISAAVNDTPEWFARVKPQVTWDSFPKANQSVDMVPIDFPEGHSVLGKVVRYQSKEGQFELDYVLGIRNQIKYDEVRFEGPLVSFRSRCDLMLPNNEVIGQHIVLDYDDNGDLLSLALHAIAVSHVRMAPNGKLETRGILATEAVRSLNGSDLSAIRQVINSTPTVTVLPDKLALLNFPVEELYFQDLRIVRDYGICIQSTAAGPGILELEAISLDPPSTEQPWIFIGGKNAWDMIPLSQRTGEAG